MRYFLLVVVIFLISISIVNANFNPESLMNIETSCIDNSTLYQSIEANYYLNDTNGTLHLQKTEKWNNTKSCLHGCYNGVCSEDSKNESIWIASLMIVSSIFLGFMSFKFETSRLETYGLQILFFTLSLFLLIGSFFGFYNASEINGLEALSSVMLNLYSISIWITIFILFLIYTFFIKDIYESNKVKEDEKNQY